MAKSAFGISNHLTCLLVSKPSRSVKLPNCTRSSPPSITNRRMATQTPTPKWASNTKDNDPEALNNSLSQLLAPNGSWTLIPSGEGIQRVIRFKTFKNAWSFMSSTADEMKKIRHHAEWSNTYNTVFVRWTTHSPKGLSHLDIRMAEVTDRIARECQEVKGDDGGDAAGATRLAGLVDDVERGAGDCCVPKKKIAQS